jgi:hypothetical protein
MEGTSGVADGLPLASLVTLVAGHEVYHSEDLTVLSTQSLQKILFQRAHQLATEDLPSELLQTQIKVGNINSSTHRIQYLTPDNKTLYVQSSVPIPNSDEYSLQALYTYEIHPQTLGMLIARNWYEKKVHKYHGDPTIPLFYILCKGMRHFEKQNNSHAVQIMTQCAHAYFSVITTQVAKDFSADHKTSDANASVFNNFLSKYFPNITNPVNLQHLVQHEYSFYEQLVNKFGGEFIDFEFNNSLRLVMFYRVHKIDTDAKYNALQRLVASHGGRIYRKRKSPKDSYDILGMPLVSPILGISFSQNPTDQDELADVSRLQQLLFPTAMVEKLGPKSMVSAPLYQNKQVDALGYRLTGAWINVRSYLLHPQPSFDSSRQKAIAPWVSSLEVERKIAKNVQHHPFTLGEATQVVLSYWSIKLFLKYYQQSRDLMTTREILSAVTGIAAASTRDFPHSEFNRNRVLLQEKFISPWQQQVLRRYNVFDRYSPFLKLLEERDLDFILATNENEQMVAEQRYTGGYWNLLLTYWIKIQELDILVTRAQSNDHLIARKQEWLYKKALEFKASPAEMRQYLPLEFEHWTHLTLANLLCQAQPLGQGLKLYHHQREKLQEQLASTLIPEEMEEWPTVLRTLVESLVEMVTTLEYCQLQMVEELIQNAGSDPKPLFIQRPL